MFEFGRDLRKLFEKARESEDLGWLELIGADLVEACENGEFPGSAGEFLSEGLVGVRPRGKHCLLQ